MRLSNKWICVMCASLALGVSAGCNRTVSGMEGGHFSEGESDESTGDDGSTDPEEPDYPESCGDGVIDPGEFCHRPTHWGDSGIDPCSLSVADFDHDGHMDLAVPNSDWGLGAGGVFEANVLFGLGDGTTGDSRAYGAGAELPVGLAVGDVDGDGWADLITANFESSEAALLRNAGDGTFVGAQGLPLGTSANSAHPGDLDGDGLTDVGIVSNGGVSILMADGFGGFWPAYFFDTGGSPTHALFVDINQDGDQDMVVTDSGSNEIEVWRGDGTGGFDEVVRYEVGDSPAWVVYADISGDSDLDLVVANHGDDTISILTGNDEGGFAPERVYDAGSGPQSVAVGDFDMDGHPDMVATNDNDNRVAVLLNTEPEEFEIVARFAAGSRPVSVKVADFNEDGVLDFAWADQFSNRVQIVSSDP